MECGFANWSRMRRACLLEFGMTPQQMEYAIADEIADYYDAGATVRNRNQLLMDKDLPERLRGIFEKPALAAPGAGGAE